VRDIEWEDLTQKAQRREDANGMARLNELIQSVKVFDCFPALREIFMRCAISREAEVGHALKTGSIG
jgi:hypothetical protein